MASIDSVVSEEKMLENVDNIHAYTQTTEAGEQKSNILYSLIDLVWFLFV